MKKFLIVALTIAGIILTAPLRASDEPAKDQENATTVDEGVSVEKAADKEECLPAKNEAEQEQDKPAIVGDISCNLMEEWIEFSTRPNGDVFFFNNARVEKNGNQISVWIRVRYKTSIMAAASYQNLTRLDCSDNSETILQDTFYTDKNWTKPAMATNTNAKPKKQVQEKSATRQLINILCED